MDFRKHTPNGNSETHLKTKYGEAENPGIRVFSGKIMALKIEPLKETDIEVCKLDNLADSDAVLEFLDVRFAGDAFRRVIGLGIKPIIYVEESPNVEKIQTSASDFIAGLKVQREQAKVAGQLQIAVLERQIDSIEAELEVASKVA